MKLADIKAGDLLIAGDGFDCLDKGAVREVKVGTDRGLFIDCRRGRHYLDGELVGFLKAEPDDPCHGPDDRWCPSCGLGGSKL